jgi:DNA repair exonuclease SbcCD ATPase subunit
MTTVLITADVHIMDYRSHNLFNDPQFRIKQFSKLARRIVEMIDETGAVAVIIAGDFLHVASPRPYVVNAAFEFLDIITQRQVEVYLTHGQHDYDSRTRMDGQHTLLTLCNRIPQVKYLHKEQLSIGNTSFYFLGWEPNWEDYVKSIPRSDVLIGHAQPYNVLVGQRGLQMGGGVFASSSSTSPFTLAFLGDIHYHQHRDNWVVPGTPIQHCFNDHPGCGIIALDLETLAWRHLPTLVPGRWDFLQLVITDTSSEDPFVVTRPKTSTSIAEIREEIDRTVDTLQIITQAVHEEELFDIHEQILQSVSKDIREETNLLFEITHMKVRDFRSIKYFTWENIERGVKLIHGKNGTGKSSLLSALIFGLTGEGDARKLARNESKHMEVEIGVKFNGLKHTIRRGWATGGKTHYEIEGQEQVAENQNILKKKILDNLPFLEMMDLMYHRQDRSGFLSSYNYGARVELITRVLGLRIVDALSQAVQLRLLEVDQRLTALRERVASVAAILEQETLVDFSALEMVDEKTEESLRDLHQRVEDALSTERRRYQETVALQTALINCIQRTTEEITHLESRERKVHKQQCYTCGQPLDSAKLEKILLEITQELERKRELLTRSQQEYAELEQRNTLKSYADAIGKLERKVTEVTTHLGEITAMKDHAESLLNLKQVIEKSRTEREEIQCEEEQVSLEHERLRCYQRLFEKNGKVMRTLLETVSTILSTPNLRVRAYKELVNKELRPDFGVDMLIDGRWISYDELSGGQKSVADLTLLEKLIRVVGGVGVLFFDETFKFLDNENLERVVDIIKSMHCHSIFIVSHAEEFPHFDTSISSSKNEHGTKYAIL